MITLVFLSLCLIEAIIIWMKWNEIQDYRNLGKDVASVTGLDKNEKYGAFVRIAGKVLAYAKPILIVLGIVLLVVNYIAALIIGGILNIFF